jgi:hypothetical protein
MERSTLSLNKMTAIACTVFAIILVIAGCGQANSNAQNAKASFPRPSAGPVKPDVLAIDEVNLEDEVPVIGVSVGSHHRAYLVEALDGSWEGVLATGDEPLGQVVNDFLGGVPITVTYCSRNQRCRVLTGPGIQPLQLAVEDSKDPEGMALRSGSQTFEQSDPKLPLQDYPFETTTWKDWRSAHPETDVYLGPLEEG